MKKSRITAVSAALCISLGLFGCSEKAPEESQSDATIIPTNPASEQPVPEEVVEPFISYFKGYSEKDAVMAFRATTPDAYIETLKATDNYDATIEDMEAQLEANYQMWTEMYGENVVGTYEGEVSNTVLTEEQLGLAQRCIEYYYYGIEPRIDVTEGYEVTFNYAITGDTDSLNAEETACFVKIDSQWVMIPSPAEALNSYAYASDPYLEVELNGGDQ